MRGLSPACEGSEFRLSGGRNRPDLYPRKSAPCLPSGDWVGEQQRAGWAPIGASCGAELLGVDPEKVQSPWGLRRGGPTPAQNSLYQPLSDHKQGDWSLRCHSCQHHYLGWASQDYRGPAHPTLLGHMPEETRWGPPRIPLSPLSWWSLVGPQPLLVESGQPPGSRVQA